MRTQLVIATIAGLILFGITTVEADHVDGHIDPDTLKSSYTYSIVERLPSGYNMPPEYNKVIQDGIQDGLNSWQDIDEFYYTYDSSNADILVILEVAEPTQEGTFHFGQTNYVNCITNDKIQCEITVYIDVNLNGKQTLLSYETIKIVAAHEFGHSLGLPHHTDRDHLMFGYDAKTAYKITGIKPPNLTLLTHNQNILQYYDIANWFHINQTMTEWHNNETLICNYYNIHGTENGICYTNTTYDFMQHHTTQQFLEYIKDEIQQNEEIWHQMAVVVDIIHRLSVELYNMIK